MFRRHNETYRSVLIGSGIRRVTEVHPFDPALGGPSVCRLACTRSHSSESISSRLGLHSRAIVHGLIYLRRVGSERKCEVHRFIGRIRGLFLLLPIRGI